MLRLVTTVFPSSANVRFGQLGQSDPRDAEVPGGGVMARHIAATTRPSLFFVPLSSLLSPLGVGAATAAVSRRGVHRAGRIDFEGQVRALPARFAISPVTDSRTALAPARRGGSSVLGEQVDQSARTCVGLHAVHIRDRRSRSGRRSATLTDRRAAGAHRRVPPPSSVSASIDAILPSSPRPCRALSSSSSPPRRSIR